MSNTDPDYDKYDRDPRTPCKYGIKCYQKNPKHHEKYKHPPKQQNKDSTKHSLKKLKAETSEQKVKEMVTKCEISDSDDYDIQDDSNSDEGEKLSSDASNLDEGAQKQEKKIVTISNNVSDSDETDTECDNKEPNEVSKDIDHNSGNEVSKDTDHNNKHEKDINEEKTTITTLSPKVFIKGKFLVNMPEDFYQFWDFCKKFKPNNPLEALKDIGLILVGPFEVLAGKFNKEKKPEEYLIHWRYYHDPPEFQTVLKGDDKTGYHIGYFRDSPEELPVLLASNYAKRDGILHQMGGNIFTAVDIYLDELKKSGDPFKKMHIGRIQTVVKKETEKLKIDLSHRTDAMIAREKKIVTRTFNKIGLVVPYNKKTQQGYRELALGNKDFASLLTKLRCALPEQRSKYLSELQPVFTYASIATDECDFGTGIELGWNIIAHGVDCLDSTALRSLTNNYRLLNREAFAKIAEAHLCNRKKGCNLSII